MSPLRSRSANRRFDGPTCGSARRGKPLRPRDRFVAGRRSLTTFLITGTTFFVLLAGVELEPSGDTRRAALPSGLAQAGGSAAGAITVDCPVGIARVRRRLSD